MLDLNREFPVIPGDLLPDNIARELQNQLNHLLGRRSQTFIGSQPVSFAEKHIDEALSRRDYFVCEKSDGLRCLMLNTVDPDGKEATILITRENQFYLVPGFHFPLVDNEEGFHTNTLIDGELVLAKRADGNGKELKYLMFDCLLMNGQNCITYPLHKRLGKLAELFFKPYSKFCTAHPSFTVNNRFKVRMKDMKTSYNLMAVLDAADTQAHISDGLIFTCCETAYIFGTDPTLLKWKPSEENTIDFKMELDIPTYTDPDLDEHNPEKSYPNYDAIPRITLNIWLGDDDHTGESKYEYFTDLTITGEEWDELKALNEPLNGRIVECNRNTKGEWRFLRFRDDKSNGNHKTTFEKVIQSIEDGVSKEELAKVAPILREKWKARERERAQGRGKVDDRQRQAELEHKRHEEEKRQRYLKEKAERERRAKEQQKRHDPLDFGQDDDFDDVPNGDVPTYDQDSSDENNGDADVDGNGNGNDNGDGDHDGEMIEWDDDDLDDL